MIIQQILIGLTLCVVGVLMLKYSFQLTNITGNIGFAERFLGGGGTYSLYKILGVGLAIFGLLYMTGLGTALLQWLLAPLAKYFQPSA